MADIPGLIEGAHEGSGLGDRFLGHVERCAVLLHLVDGTEEDPAQAYRTIRGELAAYGEGLAEKPEIVFLSKCDALDADQRKTRLNALEAAVGQPVAAISSASGAGVQEALRGLWQAVAAKKRAAQAAEEAPVEKQVYDPMVGLK